MLVCKHLSYINPVSAILDMIVASDFLSLSMNASLKQLVYTISALFASKQIRTARLACYHCHQSMIEDQAISVQFAGANQLVCCHGCQAVLQTIVANHLVDDYLQMKRNLATQPEAA